MSGPRFADFTYPADEDPRGVMEVGLAPNVVAAIDRQAQAVGAALGHRIGECLLASTISIRLLRPAVNDRSCPGGSGSAF